VKTEEVHLTLWFVTLTAVNIKMSDCFAALRRKFNTMAGRDDAGFDILHN
jgi:hypothetical protein